MTSPQPPDETAVDYDATIQKINAPVRNLYGEVKSNTRRVRVGMIVILIDLVFSLFLWQGHTQNLKVQRRQAKSDLSLQFQAAKFNYDGCVRGNDFRAGDLKLWATILSLPPQPGLTPAQAAQQAQTRVFFINFLKTHDAFANCGPDPATLPMFKTVLPPPDGGAVHPTTTIKR